MIHFADAWIFWVVGPLFLLWLTLWLLRHFLDRRKQPEASVRFSTIRTPLRLASPRSVRARRFVAALRIPAVALLLLAMGRPQVGRTERRVVTHGVDIALAIDTSGSMAALDLDSDRNLSRRRNRLAVVKDVVKTFIEKRSNDQIGMIVFGSQAFTQCPLTLDHGILETFLDHLEIGMAGDQTAIGDALGTAVKRLEKSKAKSKVVILLTDGRNNTGTLAPRTAAEIAKTLGIKVYTIGAGAAGKAPFIQDGGLFGAQVVYEDVAIDEAMLRDVASLTGGVYFRAQDAGALQKVYDRIDSMEKTEIEMKAYQEYDERFSFLVLPGLALLLLEILLLGTRFRKIP